MEEEKRVVVITGAGSGVGRAAALSFLAAGFRVALLGRRLAALEEVIATSGVPQRGFARATDVTQEQDVVDAFAAVVQRFGRVDVLFNNAGAFPPASRFDKLPFETWRTAMAVNLDGAFLCAREAFGYMVRQTPMGGRIINNGSLSAQAPRPQSAAYTAAKHAITGLTRSIQLDGRAFHIACGQIDIGNAATGLTDGFGTGALQADGSTKSEPMISVEAVADAVLQMASLPLEANIPFMTVMATAMPFVGRG
jgi:NAD(P)-dependent dehydrogenase (short-subunit alcohol dehydrogenase family)